MIPSIVIVRRRRKQLFILLVNMGIRYLGEVLWCQISLGNVVGGGGSMNTFSVLPAALPVLIIRGCTGLTAWGGLYACKDYWQCAPAKQQQKANNCLKVNNNTLLSWQEVCLCVKEGGVNQIELISPTYVSFMRRSYEACFSWFIFMAYAQKCEGVKGFSRKHKVMNRGCRATAICL